MIISVKWFPPSWFQIKTKDKILYIDPAYLKTNFINYPKKIEFSAWPDPIDGLPEKLELGDIILITHHHKDHCKGVTVNRLKKPDTLIIATKQCIKELGTDISIISPGEEIESGNIKIKAVYAYNIKQGNTLKVMHKKGIGIGYLVNIEGKIIYHAGDTDFIPEMREIDRVDLALLPIGGRGFTMDMDAAIEAVIELSPKTVIPMHRYEADPIEFKRKVETKTNIDIIPLITGEVYRV
ncbi:MAG: MBL fold metallo-hydrolase [Thermodesulfobacteriota bacterium]|nr:MBL fold metallo-hydrolase [Thermodesulfobacteriota bacterium]